MNRQAANYVESVGDNKNYEWQTPKHNFWCLLVTIFLLGITFALFYVQNRAGLDEFSVEIIDSVPNLKKFEYHIDFGKRKDFERGANYGRTTTISQEQFEGFRIYATCDIDKQKYLNILNDSAYIIHHGDSIEAQLRRMSNKAKPNASYGLYEFQNIHFKTRINSPYLSSIMSTRQKLKYTQDKPKVDTSLFYEGPYKRDISYYYKKDTFCLISDFHLYKAVERTYVDKVVGEETRIIDGKMETVQKIGRYSTYAIYSPDSVFGYFNEMFMGAANKHWNPFVNLSTCNIRIKGIQFPRAEQNELVLSFNAPMNFDIISISPDSATDTQLIFNSPAKIKRIEQGDLYVYARSVASINIQETVNFVYATLIGLIFSFLIEFSKRLYKYRRQRIFETGKETRLFEKLFIGLMLWWAYDIVKRNIQKIVYLTQAKKNKKDS